MKKVFTELPAGMYPNERIPRNYDTHEKLKHYYREIFYGAQTDQAGSDRAADYEAIIDGDKSRMERRRDAALKYWHILKDDIEKTCPDVLGVYYGVEEWAFLNARCGGAYDGLEAIYHLSYAAAIYILDTLYDQGKREEVNRLMDEVFDEIGTDGAYLSIWYPRFHSMEIDAVEYIIAHRNDDCTGYRKRIPENLYQNGYRRIFMDDITAAQKQHQDVPSRRRYEKLIHMLSDETVDHAENHFRTTWNELLHRYFQCRKILARKQKALMNRYDNWNRYTAGAADAMILKQKALDHFSSAAGSPMHVSKMTMEDTFASSSKVSSDYHARQESDYRLSGQIMNLWSSLMNCARIPEPEEQNLKDIQRVMEDFDPGDLYELSFALLNLIDHDDQLMQLYGISVSLAEAIGGASAMECRGAF